MMNEQVIFEKIVSIALKLYNEKSKYTRADLAFELKEFGVQGDSVVIEDLLWTVFEVNNGQVKEAISAVFFDNQMKKNLISINGTQSLIRNSEYETALSLLKKNTGEIPVAFSLLRQEINMHLEDASHFIPEKAGLNLNELTKTITGASKIEKVKTEAIYVLDKYNSIIGGYEKTKQEILNLIDDYVLVRSEIVREYRKYVTELVDVFGSKIKALDPVLFDFKKIEYVDTESMKKETELAFSGLVNSCSQLMLEIGDNFFKGYENIIGKDKSRGVAVAMAGFELLRSQLDSSEKALRMRSELEVLRNKMLGDVALVKSDLCRLEIIGKTMNELHLPVATMFNNRTSEVFTKNLEQLFENLYNSPKLLNLKVEKEALLQDFHQLELEITDHSNHINSYSLQISNNKKLLDEFSPLYFKAMQEKPQKPFFLIDILLFGSLSKKHARESAHWFQLNGVLIERYSELTEDVKIDKEELENHKVSLKDKKQKYALIHSEIEKKCLTLNKELSLDTQAQIAIAPHLTNIINLLRTARRIAELKIEDNQLQTISMRSFQNQELPEEIKTKLASMTSKLDNSLNKKSHELKSNVLKEYDVHPDSEIGQQANQAVDGVLSIIKAYGDLKILQNKNAKSQEFYDAEFAKLKTELKKKALNIGDKAVVLRAVIGKINRSPNNQLNGLLLELIDENDQDWFSELEIIELLKENKNITI